MARGTSRLARTARHSPPAVCIRVRRSCDLPLSKKLPVVIREVAGFEVDSESVPVLTARWLYAEVRQGARDMQRVGLAV